MPLYIIYHSFVEASTQKCFSLINLFSLINKTENNGRRHNTEKTTTGVTTLKIMADFVTLIKQCYNTERTGYVLYVLYIFLTKRKNYDTFYNFTFYRLCFLSYTNTQNLLIFDIDIKNYYNSFIIYNACSLLYAIM